MVVIWPAFARCYSSFTLAFSNFNPRPASAQQPLYGPEVERSSRLPHGGQRGPRSGARAATAETVLHRKEMDRPDGSSREASATTELGLPQPFA